MATGVEVAAMRRALELAARGRRTRNPQVGAVILSPTGETLAEGWHHGAGTAHAEVDALSHLDDARGATAVVTLEPCNHTGRTGPCSEALIAAGVSRVVYALPDPGAREGGGAERLRAAGVDVAGGVLDDEARTLLDPWLMARQLGRPHVTVKWAQSLDGRAAAADGSSQWITGSAARADVHRRRAAADAIVVGTGTVLADDPALTARTDTDLDDRQPVPVVVGSREIPAGARIRQHPRTPIIHATRDLVSVLDDLFDRGLYRAFVEGGPTLASAFVAADLADELLAYIAPTLLGGPRSALSDIGVDTITRQRRLAVETVVPLGDDLLVVATPADPVRRLRETTADEAPSRPNAAQSAPNAPDGPTSSRESENS